MMKRLKSMVAVLSVVAGAGAFAGNEDSLAARVAADFPEKPASGICRYWVPAMSERQYLPDAYPEDGKPGWPVKIVAAKDEYEPGAFLLYATKDFPKMDFVVSDLKNEKGDVIPASETDLKTVKVWYQNGNGWFSYFQDVGKKLCPELLLHDEDLVRVDTKKQDNWARLTEKDGRVHEFWLTAPRGVYGCPNDIGGDRKDDTFLCMKENFSDAPAFAGASLKKGEFKEFLLTVHVGKGVKAGLYKGEIRLTGQRSKVKGQAEGQRSKVKCQAEGQRSKVKGQTEDVNHNCLTSDLGPQTSTRTSDLGPRTSQVIETIPVELRVHDFSLPTPKCYFDITKDFETRFCEYISENIVRQSNGNDGELALRQIAAIAKDFIRHGETIGVNPWGSAATEKIAKEAGFDMRKSYWGGMTLSDNAESRLGAKHLARRMDKKFGSHKGLLVSWGDEYGLGTLRGIRDMVGFYHDEGFRFAVNSHSGYNAGANIADLWWPPYTPDHQSAPTTFNYNNMTAGEGYFGWYANQHVGTENPAFIRRQYGFGPYRAGLSCNFNYAHHLQGWNDIAHTLYKPMIFVYGSGNGCIDTLAWEGFREGQDDIRYATLLQQLARKHLKDGSTQARYAARLALKLLADADKDDMDLMTLRLEMIEWIEKMLAVK